MIRQALILSAVLLGGCDKPRDYASEYAQMRYAQIDAEAGARMRLNQRENAKSICRALPSKEVSDCFARLPSLSDAALKPERFRKIMSLHKHYDGTLWDMASNKRFDPKQWHDTGKGPRAMPVDPRWDTERHNPNGTDHKFCLGRIENNRCIRRVEINGTVREIEK